MSLRPLSFFFLLSFFILAHGNHVHAASRLSVKQIPCRCKGTLEEPVTLLLALLLPSWGRSLILLSPARIGTVRNRHLRTRNYIPTVSIQGSTHSVYKEARYLIGGRLSARDTVIFVPSSFSPSIYFTASWHSRAKIPQEPIRPLHFTVLSITLVLIGDVHLSQPPRAHTYMKTLPQSLKCYRRHGNLVRGLPSR